MWRRNTLVFTFAILLGLALALEPTTGLAQQKSLKEQLTGIWTFGSALETSKDGKTSDRWGANPKGMIIFDASGRYSFMISRSDIPKFAANTVTQGTAEENKAVVHGIIVYIGTWSVDEGTKTLITNIEASSFPNVNGTSQKRIITSLTADELRYTNPAATTGTVAEVVWKRAK